MAAQLCDRDIEGEYVFKDHRTREYTNRANVFELRRYMITLRARNAFLHGLDVFAEHEAERMRQWTIDLLLRECCNLKLVRLVGKGRHWTCADFYLEMRQHDLNDRIATQKAADHWRGACRDCGLSDSMSVGLARAEMSLVNNAIRHAVTQFSEAHKVYVEERQRTGGCMNAKMAGPHEKMHHALLAAIKLGVVRLGMKCTSLNDFFLDNSCAWHQDCLAAAKEVEASASLAPRYLCLFGHIADQMREDRTRFVALQGLRLNLDLPGSKRVKLLAKKHVESGAIGA